MIASIAFRNFKALRATGLALGPFNLVIGPNGSGKTSLIQALLQLRTLSKLRPQPAGGPVQKHGGPEIQFHFSAPNDAIVVRLGCVSEVKCDVLHVSPVNAPGWPLLRSEVARIRSYVLDHAAMGLPSRRRDNAELHPNGSNLASVLAAMRERAPDALHALRIEMQRIMPEFRALEFVEHGDDHVGLGLRLADHGVVEATELSQGALYLLGMLTLAFDPAPPRVLCIEEVDRGIHPRMLREIRDALYRLSYPRSFGLERPPVQVVTTTHSPYFIDLFREHPEEVIISQRRGAAAVFERLADRPDLPELLREGSLGDMWFSGILGGVPDEP